jgi:hypothetical protein
LTGSELQWDAGELQPSLRGRVVAFVPMRA